MTLERATMAFAGFMVFLSVVLTYLAHPYFVALTVYVALNLFQSAFTGFCPAATMLHKLGFRNEVERARMQANLPSNIGLTQ